MTEDIRFDSAEAFLAALRRSEKRWLDTDHDECNWIFRGQGNATHSLLPKAVRPTAQTNPLYAQTRANITEREIQRGLRNNGVLIRQLGCSQERAIELIIQRHFEWRILRHFQAMVDELGLYVPGRVGPFQHGIDDPNLGQQELTAVHALAQHHGLPTRLLDWTRNPLVAAFFASQGAKVDEEGDIAVWAINLSSMYDLACDCRLFTVPRFQFGYLHAQEGVFTYHERADSHFLSTGRWQPHNELWLSVPPLRLLLPKAQAPALEQLLWIERVSKAHLMPTLDNVAGALLDHWAAMERRIKPSAN